MSERSTQLDSSISNGANEVDLDCFYHGDIIDEWLKMMKELREIIDEQHKVNNELKALSGREYLREEDTDSHLWNYIKINQLKRKRRDIREKLDKKWTNCMKIIRGDKSLIFEKQIRLDSDDEEDNS